MHFYGRTEADSQFQIAPMIDIVFLLLVFFVAVLAVGQQERQLKIQLPEATAAREERRTMEDLLVNLDADGQIFLYRSKCSPEYLEARLLRLAAFAEGEGNLPGVIIRADGACDHRHVVRVMDICARARVQRVFFSAVASENDPAPAGTVATNQGE